MVTRLRSNTMLATAMLVPMLQQSIADLEKQCDVVEERAGRPAAACFDYYEALKMSAN